MRSEGVRGIAACALGIVLGVGGARRAHAGATCEQAVDHVLEVMAAEGGPFDDWETYLASLRTDMIAACTAQPASDEELACVIAASSTGAMAGCEPAAAPRAGLSIALPALSADGKTLALPSYSHELGESHERVELVALGKTTGEELDVSADFVDTGGGSPPVFGPPMTEDHTADVEARLKAGGFAPVSSGAATGAVDGVTATVRGPATKLTVKLRAGGKSLGKLKVAATRGGEVGVDQLVVVRGKTSWIYVSSEEVRDFGESLTEWHALKVKLPPRKDLPMPALAAARDPSGQETAAADAAVAALGCEPQGYAAAGGTSGDRAWIGVACELGGALGVAVVALGEGGGLVGSTATGGDHVTIQDVEVHDAGFPLVCASWYRENGEKSYRMLDCFAPGRPDPVFEGSPDRFRYDFVGGATPAIVETNLAGKKKHATRATWNGTAFQR